MEFDSLNIELFKPGKEFNQILFLDNFYENVSIEKNTGEDISKLLITAINHSVNTYVKRSAFKILCDLTLIKKINNRFSTLGYLHVFLSSEESSLQAVALKYMPHFPETYFRKEEKLKELSESSNGEVASQAYLCLGLIQLTSGISNNDTTGLIVTLNKTIPYFIAATQATENRIDADYYLLLIDWIKKIIANDHHSAQIKFIELEKNLQIRNLYDFEESGLEFNFLIFQLTQQIRASFEIAIKSKEWLDIPRQVQALLNISLETQKIRNIQTTNQAIIQMLYAKTFESIQTSIYNLHLATEKQRLQALINQTQNTQLKHFIEYLLVNFPKSNENRKENQELLALLSEFLGSRDGLKIYEQIINKEVSLEKAIANLLQKNKNNQLPFRTGSIQGQEVLISLMSQIDKNLQEYQIDKREAFFNIVEEVIRYVRTTLVGHEKKRFLFLYAKTEKGKGQNALEQDLQDSMYTYFEHSKIADGLDHEKAKFVDGGRVDIIYKKDLITIPIELKRTFNRLDKDTLEQNYIAQAQTYSSGYDQLGIFVLLELSIKSKEPPPNFKDWFKIHHLPPSTNQKIEYPDYIISVIIPGNRTSPSAKSIYA